VRSSQLQLSKSKFVAGIQCLKRLYLQVHNPELAAVLDEGTEAILSQGQEVGLLALRAFPLGVLVQSNHDELDEALTRTQRLIADPQVPAIFEATFRHQGVLVRVDILERASPKGWRLIEVKSTTGVKDYHLFDVAIQRHVVSGCGIDVAAACLMHLNRDYVYDGQEYRIRKLFKIEDVTKEIRKINRDLPTLLEDQWKALNRKSPPNIEPGRQCEDPVGCEFYDQCNETLPADHVSCLPRISQTKIAVLVDRGISLISEIPNDFPLGVLARRACDSMQGGGTWFSGGLREELRRLKYPLSFMDFETLYPAIPRYAGMRPYSHIPFQWSVHRQHRPGEQLEHFEFLARDDSDPRRGFIESLCRVARGKGHIVVYNRSFEASRLAELAVWLPDYAGQVEQIRERLWDLLPIIRGHVYHPGFHGSYSIKNVLPALIPGMMYSGMEIADGGQAGLAWDRLIRNDLDEAQKEDLRRALLAYCAQDTLAMARILQYLQSAGTRPSDDSRDSGWGRRPGANFMGRTVGS
jgi:predicted RecB family nuclease